MGTGGTPAALEALWRYVAGDPNWERLQPALRARMQSTAETFFGVELGSYEGFLPDDKTLAAIAVPVMVLVSEQSHAVYAQAADLQRQGWDQLTTETAHIAVIWLTVVRAAPRAVPAYRSGRGEEPLVELACGRAG